MSDIDIDELKKMLNDYTIHAAHPFKCKDDAYLVNELKRRLTAWRDAAVVEAMAAEVSRTLKLVNDPTVTKLTLLRILRTRIIKLNEQSREEKSLESSIPRH